MSDHNETLTLNNLAHKLRADLELHTNTETNQDQMRESLKALLVFAVDILALQGIPDDES
jgi:hypothetical protein